MPTMSTNAPPFRLAGVMGWPVAHSRSPKLHSFWLAKHRIAGAYVPLAVRPENLPAALKGLAALGFAGGNLTIPHKEAALHLVDRVDPMARRIGAINTIVVAPDGTLDGDLVLRGAGDPTLGGRFADEAGTLPMVTLARSVAAAGVRRVSGALVGDASGFDDGKVPDGWRRRYLHASYAARVSALSFNENQVIVLVRPDGHSAWRGDAVPADAMRVIDRKSTRLNSSHVKRSRMPSSA